MSAVNGASMSPEAIQNFQESVWGYYRDHGRHELPWRQAAAEGSFDPYRIMVSEVMLQQTQVNRVIPKFNEFVCTFPNVATLSEAPLADVLRLWSGLGYNRRAKFLWQAAGSVVSNFHGQVPQTIQQLATLPGIGLNTAGAIVAYGFNVPVVFIETNIRTVVLYCCYPDESQVTDKEILRIVQETLPEAGLTREWYWALMDYGSHLKHAVGNLSRAAAGYVRQSPFEGSTRQIRGAVLRLLQGGPKTSSDMRTAINDERLTVVLTGLMHDELIHEQGGRFILGV